MRISIALFAVAAIALAAAPPASAAEFRVSTWADSAASGPDGLIDNPAPTTDAEEGPEPGVSATSSSGASLTRLWGAGSAAWNGSGHASATADAGGIHLMTSGAAEVIDAEPFFGHSTRGDGIADGEFTDTFVLQANGVPAGTFLRARAEIVVDSALTASANDVDFSFSADEVWGGSGWSVMVRVKANGFTQLDTFFSSPECIHRLSISPDLNCPESSERRTIFFDVPVGGVTEVWLYGTAQAGGLVGIGSGGYASANGTANLSNTIGWGGVLELATQDEVPVTDFSMISEATGIDYRHAQAAPEPSHALLGAMALAGLGALRSRS